MLVQVDYMPLLVEMCMSGFCLSAGLPSNLVLFACTSFDTAL